MKLVVLGATGNTGLQLVQQALERGHEVTALVRNTSRLENIQNDKFHLVKCNILDSSELEVNFVGHDCILSALGSPGLRIFKNTFMADSIKAIVDAMRKTNIKRIVICGSQYTKPGLAYSTFYYVFLRPMIGRQLDELNDMEDYLFNQCSQDIDFTIVRPPRLLDTPISDANPILGVDQYFFTGDNNSKRISRANVAKYMLDLVVSNEYLKKGVAIDMPLNTQ